MKLFTLTIIFFLSCTVLFAQNKPAVGEKIMLRGRVIDQQDKQAVIGASVTELDKDRRAVSAVSTDIDGNFALKISNPNNSLQVTFISYKTFVAPINGRTVINVTLVPAKNELAEVTITGRQMTGNGTGLNIDARNSTMASSTVSAKDLEELSAQSVDQALQGRMPGVDIGTGSGDPGAGMSIRIRGTSSINGSSDPLIVLDGMPFETQVPDDFNFGTADEQGYAQLLNIAPTDIKEITVLKDAASTAVWGARAANGVLLITTKRGVIGKPVVTYSLKATASRQPEAIPMLSGNQYSMLIPEEINNRNGLPINNLNFPEFNYDPKDPFNFYNYSNNTDWIKEITQLGYSHDHNISMQGGGERARYYASVGYLNQQGTTLGTALDRITTKINLDYNVSNRIKFRSDFSYTHVNNSLNYTTSLRDVAYNKMPNMAPYQYDEFGNLTPVFFSPSQNIQGQASLKLDKGNYVLSGTYNPLAMAEASSSKLYGERIIPHFNLQYSLVPNIFLTTFDVQFDINNTKSTAFLPQIATGRSATESIVNRAIDNDGDTYIVDTKLNFLFTPVFKNQKHTLQSILSVQTHDAKSVGQNITTANSASSYLTDVADAARVQGNDLSLKSTLSQSRSFGVVMTHQYSLLDRYIVNGGLRLDGNSKFGPDNRYALFPSLSARWRISGEPFMKKFEFVDDFSFRLSYGEAGKEPDDNYKFYNTYNPTVSSYAGLSGVTPGNLGLDNLRWQTNIGRNIGFNLNTFKNRLKLDVDLYKNKIVDMFFDKLQTPGYTGYTQLPLANVGVMVNQGFEVSLNTQPYKSKKLIVGFDFNIARNDNIIQEVSEFYPRTDGKKVNTNGQYRTFLQIGNPFGSFYGFKYKGVYTDDQATIAKAANGKPIISPTGEQIRMRFNYPATDYTFQAGDAMYEDVNFDGNINEDDLVYLGNGTPRVTGGFGPYVTIKGNLRLQAFFNYKLGYQLINETLITTTNMSGYSNQSTIVLRRWRNPGDVTDVPRALQGSGYNWLGSDRYVSDASFLRLKTITMRYNLTKKMASKLKMKNASIYVTAENLYTWTNYKGVDPDISARGSNDPFKYVSDKAMTPPSKNLLTGITVGF